MKKLKWSSFWLDEKKAFIPVMELSTSVFAKKLDKLLKLNKSHRVLDYGCGPGFLMNYLITKDIFACGVDINSFYIDECLKKNISSKVSLITSELSTNEKLLKKEFNDLKFDFIVILSITQYMEDEQYLEDLIKMLNYFLKDDGKIVIADVVDSNTSTIIDGLAVLGYCLISGKLNELFKLINYLLFSNYNLLSRHIKLKEFSENSIDLIAKRSLMNSTSIKGLTIHPTRSNYILTKHPFNI